MKKVATIVVTYNRKELLKENLNALLKQTYKSDIYLIDNASTDGTYDYVKNIIEKNNIKYFNTGENLGGAGGFNYGMKQLEGKGYDYCWIMDDDTIPNSDSLEAHIKVAKKIDDNFSFLGSVVKWTDGKLCRMNVQGVSSSSIHNYESLFNNLLTIDYCSFVSCFINMKYVYEVGLPIKEFFIYGDDMEYTKRLSTKAPGYLNPYSIVMHKMNSNIGINIVDCDVNRIDRYFYNYRNLYYIYRKYDKKELRLFKIKAPYLQLKIFFKSKNKFKRMHAIGKGMRKGKKFNPSIEFIKK